MDAPNIADRIRDMTDDERRWFLMWLAGYQPEEFTRWLDRWQDRANPAGVTADVG